MIKTRPTGIRWRSTEWPKPKIPPPPTRRGLRIDFARFKELVRENQSRVNKLFERMLAILGN